MPQIRPRISCKYPGRMPDIATQRQHKYPNRNGPEGRFKVKDLRAEKEFGSLARMRRLSAGFSPTHQYTQPGFSIKALFSAIPVLIGRIVCRATQAKTKTDPRVRFE